MHLRYGLTGRPGVTVLVGEAGTGKTTLVRAALQAVERAQRDDRAFVESDAHAAEFYEYLASGFGFRPDAGNVEDAFPARARTHARLAAADGGVLALVVDEAQSLPHELLEEIRLLTNAESNGRSLAVALVGQPELAAGSTNRSCGS